MRNEKITENLVRKRMEVLGMFSESRFCVEEQKSGNPRINKLLSNASKSGNGAGRPEFIVFSKADSDFVLLVECKADPKFHESKTRESFRDYAVDGALLYASHLSREFHTIAVAVSGQSKEELVISTFLHPKEMDRAVELTDKSGMPTGNFAVGSVYGVCEV